MKASFRDLSLWRQLLDGDAQSLVEPLHALALCEPLDRVMHLGRLEPYIHHESPALRCAALEALGGAAGPTAFRWLIEGLGDPTTQAAAFAALARSCEFDSMRWWHVLLHPDDAVRRAAIDQLPRDFPLQDLLFLLPDQANRALLVEALTPLPMGDDTLSMLLALHHKGELSRIELLEWLAPLPWEKYGYLYLQGLSNQRDMIETPETLVELEALLTSTTLPRDARDDFFLLIWEELERQPQEETATLARSIIERLWLSAQSSMPAPDRKLLAISMGRIGFHQWHWEPTPLALCTTMMPMLLTHPHIPLALRKAAACLHANGCQPLEDAPPPLAGLLASDLCYLPDGCLDLPVLGGALRLVEEHPYRELLNYIREEDLSAALQKAPEQAAQFFARPPTGHFEQSLQDALLRGLLTQSNITDETLAGLALAIPSDQLSFVAQLGSTAPTRMPGVLRALLQAYQRRARPPSANKTSHLTQHLFDALQTQCAETCSVLAEIIPLPAELPVDREGWRALFEAQPTPESLSHRGIALATDLLTMLGRHTDPQRFGEAILALPPAQLPAWLLLEKCTPSFPYGMESHLAKVLRSHQDPCVQGWLASLALPGAPIKPKLQPSRQKKSTLPAASITRLAAATNSQLEKLLKPCFTHAITGLCEALDARPPRNNIEICAALLVCHDPPDKVDTCFQRYFTPTPSLVEELDLLMVERCEQMTEMPLPGAAWLFRWERHREALIAQLTTQADGLVQGLQWTLQWETAYLGLQVWQGICLTMQQWRWREVSLLTTHFGQAEICQLLRAVLLHALLPEEEQLYHNLEPDEWVPFQVVAAKMVELLHQTGHHLTAFQALRLELLSHLSALSLEVRNALIHWLHTRGTHQSGQLPASFSTVSSAQLEEIRQTQDLAVLKGHCLTPQRPIVEEAACQLLLLDGGVDVLASLWQEALPPICARALAATLPLWPDDFGWQGLCRQCKRTESSASTRFFLALGLYERSEDTWESLLQALREDTQQSWAIHDDWVQLLRLAQKRRGPTGVQLLVHDVIDVPHPALSAQALRIVLQEPDPLSASALDQLARFLECSEPQLHPMRIEAAKRLQQHQRYDGIALVCAHIFDPRRKVHTPDASEADFFVGLPADLILEAIQGALIVGEKHIDLRSMLNYLSRPDVDPDGQQAAMLAILRTSPPGTVQQIAVGQLRTTRARQQHIQQLASTFAWGVIKGRELTGKLFGIEMIGGDHLGYTRLTTPKIYVNPLPQLRGEQHGSNIVKGLILHEFGHHIYHADESGMNTWEQARREQLHSLLNLVSDEQLERSLRAKDRSFGDYLKQLAAYAFQHAAREIAWPDLLSRLGPNAFPVLCGAALGAARKAQHTIVQMDHLLFALEAHGSSFSRFVRALRMGLGNRHQDPKVTDALRLFRKRFRHSTMPEMLEITRSLRDIFGDEIALLDLIGQEHCMNSENHDVLTIGEGMTQEELQREIERLLRGNQPSTGKGGGRTINVAKGEQFTQIATILPVAHDRTAHRQYAIKTARWSRKMRTYLQRLGLGMVPQRKRLSGHRLDRGQLQNAILRNDPRMLIARQIQYKTDLFLGILIDCSGSMEINDNIERAKLFATMLAEAAASLKGIDARFIGFTDSVLYDAGTAGKCAAHGLPIGGGNNDAAALWHAIKLALASRRKARLIVMISDGSPTECTVDALRALVNRATDRMGICCAQIALRKLDHICFPHYVEVLDDNADLAIHRFGNIIAQLVQKAIA